MICITCGKLVCSGPLCYFQGQLRYRVLKTATGMLSGIGRRVSSLFGSQQQQASTGPVSFLLLWCFLKVPLSMIKLWYSYEWRTESRSLHSDCLRGGSLCYEVSSPPISYYGRRSLRSASRGDYLIPRSYTAIKQNRAFSAAGPSIWNGLPFELCSLPRDFSSSFYSLLKTFLFARAWAGSASE